MSVKEESEVLFSEETLILEATVTSMTVTPFATLAATTEPEKGVEGSSTTLLGQGTFLWLVGLRGWVSCVCVVAKADVYRLGLWQNHKLSTRCWLVD